MRIRIASTVLAAALILAPVTGASAATAEPLEEMAPVEDTMTETDDGGDEGLWGLAGLLGLAGLAGLKRRKDTDYRDPNHAGSTSR